MVAALNRVSDRNNRAIVEAGDYLPLIIAMAGSYSKIDSHRFMPAFRRLVSLPQNSSPNRNLTHSAALQVDGLPVSGITRG